MIFQCQNVGISKMQGKLCGSVEEEDASLIFFNIVLDCNYQKNILIVLSSKNSILK